MCTCGAEGRGLVVGLHRSGWWLDLVISKVFSNLNEERLSYEKRLTELGLFSLENSTSSGGPHHCLMPEGELGSVSVAQWQNKRQWAQTGTQEVLYKYQEALFYCAGDGALVRVAQRGYGASLLGDLQKATWTLSWATVCSWPCLSRGFG